MFEAGYIFLVLVLAGLSKGLTGMGLPLVAMALLVFVLPPYEAAALLVLPAILTNLVQAISGPGLMTVLKRFWPMLCLSGLATILLSGVMVRFGQAASGMLGVLLIAFVLLRVAGPKLVISHKTERLMSPLIGLATGASTAFTGVFSLPVVPYFQTLGMKRDELVQAMGISFIVSSVALGANLGMSGSLSGVTTGWLAIALLGGFCGIWLGTRLRKRINEAVFQKVLLVALFLLGLVLVGKWLTW